MVHTQNQVSGTCGECVDTTVDSQMGESQVKDKTVKFMGVEMSEATATKMAEMNPELVKSNERKQADADREKTDDRIAPALAKIDKLLTNLLADPQSGLLHTHAL